MKVLITGATGQTANFLVEYILENHPDVEIHCTRRWRSSDEHIGNFRNKVIWQDVEMKELFCVHGVIDKIRPDRIFIFSASSFVRSSWSQPSEYVTENSSHLLNVMNSVLMINKIDLDTLTVDLKYNPKIFVALSSEEYGKVTHGVQITEETPLLPISPYGCSKVLCDLLCYQYYQSYSMNIYRFRMFNTESEKRGHIFCSASFCKQIALLEKNKIDPILHVGNIDSVRDWMDARDLVRAVWIGMEDGNCKPGETYNICSEEKHTIKEFIDRLAELSTIKFEIKVDPKRIRPSDVDFLWGNCSKFKKITGWKPHYSFLKDTVPKMLDFWRNKIAREQ